MIALHATAQYKIEVLDSNTFTLGEGVILSKTSFRGLSVVDDQTIWVSGSRGTVARSTDGGKTFTYNQLKGYEKSDFRDIEAFDDKRAIIMSSGTPAYILKTIDGGQTWKEVYKNTDTAYFLDAMDFWDDKRGILVGDPIIGHFVLLQTKDGGETWQELDTSQTPEAIEGEAVFAASGTSLRCWNCVDFAFVTGGLKSRIYTGTILSNEKYSVGSWNLPITCGKSSKGAFSLVYRKYESYVIVGGDYLADSLSSYNLATGKIVFHGCLGGYEFEGSSNELKGYKSCVEMLDNEKSIFVATGTKGVDVQEGIWKTISSEPFHVVRKAKKGKAVFFAGPKGKIGKLIY
jgi:photosystem II stability/assembly factor-like uncharacterized protein